MNSLPLRGGLNEPYCSWQCSDRANLECGARYLEGGSGQCFNCKSIVAAIRADGTERENWQGDPGRVVYVATELTFVCSSDECVEALLKLTISAGQCSYCGKQLGENDRTEMSA